jgi:hypothetical protein
MKMAHRAERLGDLENAGRGDSISAEVGGNSIRAEVRGNFLSKIGLVIGRSFGPLFALVIILGAMLWGPWVSLAIVVVGLLTAMRFV